MSTAGAVAGWLVTTLLVAGFVLPLGISTRPSSMTASDVLWFVVPLTAAMNIVLWVVIYFTEATP